MLKYLPSFLSFVLILLGNVSLLGLTPVGTLGQTNVAAPGPSRSDQTLLRFTVLNETGDVIPDLTQDAFSMSDGKVPLEIQTFSNKDEPASLVFIFDRSGSMDSIPKTELLDSIYSFLNYSNVENEYAVIRIGTKPELRLNFTNGAEPVLASLKALADEKTRREQTALLDACVLGLETALRGRHAKRVMVLVTDGQDNRSKIRWPKLLESMRRSDVMIYTLALVESSDDTLMRVVGEAGLDEMSKVTGGEFFRPRDAKDIGKAFGQIAFELRHQYRISITPAAPETKDKWHKFKLKITSPSSDKKFKGLKARGRSEYFVPAL